MSFCLCLHNTLDAHSPGCFMVQKAEKSKKIFRKFRHVTGLFPATMQAASPCSQKAIEYSLSVLLPESVSLFAQTSG